jgi:DNA helicase-2/ATP-dependent DNA helicase PcrA
LFLTHAWSRTLYGNTQYNPPSRFLDEIPAELITEAEGSRSARRRSQSRLGRASWGSHREEIVESALSARQRPEPSGADTLGLRLGDDVRHTTFGEGVILDLKGSGDNTEATVRFADGKEKVLLLSWAPLERL